MVNRDTHQPPNCRLMPQHHAIGVFSPLISRTTPFEACTHSATEPAIREAPRQLFPARAGSRPRADATVRLIIPSRAAHSASTTSHASLPRQFIVGSKPPL